MVLFFLAGFFAVETTPVIDGLTPYYIYLEEWNMMNYIGEAIVIVVAMFAGFITIGGIVKVVFDELGKYKREQLKPIEKELNGMLNSFSRAADVMCDMLLTDAKKKSSARKYEIDEKDFDVDDIK